jgi:pyrroline-5-carboxylate reductase
MQIGLIGAGNMASALARGWGEPVLATDSGSGRAAALARELGGEAATSNADLAERVEVIVLCHKPAQLDAVAAEIGDRARRVVSVLAATPLQRLRAAYPGAQVARAMPNTPVEIRRGVTCMAFDEQGDPAFAQAARDLFERVGTVVTLPDRLLDIATGLSGVAPAYLSLIVEAQVDAAVRYGLPAEQGVEILAAALEGSAALLRARDGDTLALRREVASPGGLTARGLEALERGGVRAAFSDAMAALVAGAQR